MPCRNFLQQRRRYPTVQPSIHGGITLRLVQAMCRHGRGVSCAIHGQVFSRWRRAADWISALGLEDLLQDDNGYQH